MASKEYYQEMKRYKEIKSPLSNTIYSTVSSIHASRVLKRLEGLGYEPSFQKGKSRVNITKYFGAVKIKCCYCGCDTNIDSCDIEHIIPQAMGGDYRKPNLCITLCKNCHDLKTKFERRTRNAVVPKEVYEAIQKSERELEPFSKAIQDCCIYTQNTTPSFIEGHGRAFGMRLLNALERKGYDYQTIAKVYEVLPKDIQPFKTKKIKLFLSSVQ